MCGYDPTSSAHDPTSSALTPNCTLTVFVHVVPVVPHGIFSVITPKLFSTVVLSHLFLNETEKEALMLFFF